MSKKIILLGTIIALLILISSESIFIQNNLTVSATVPSTLKIYAGPTSVLADNNAYNSIFVQLQDSTGKPARAVKDTTISLSSSLTKIGTVDSTITIPEGSTYSTAKFQSTYSPGTTTITATASGFMTVQTQITTVAPIPYKLALYGLPPILPADGNSYDAVIVQLQDASGTPAKAPIGDVQVELSSSNIASGTVNPTATIKGGSTYTVVSFKTNNTGTAVITAVATGYNSGQVTMTTQDLGTKPTTLKVYLGPPQVPADGISYRQIVVQLVDVSGKIAQTQENLPVTLSSSTTDVGKVQSTITILQSKTFALADFESTYKSGTTTITAIASNIATGQAILTTIGPIPSKLAVFCAPSAIPADSQAYNAIQVQLQDSSGRPAKNPEGDTTVYLFSSATNVGNVNTTLVIPYGKTQATGPFTSTFVASTTTITAQTSGNDPGQATITTFVVDQSTLVIELTAEPYRVISGKQTNITAYVTYDGKIPAQGATLQFASNNGGTFSPAIEKGSGYYTTIFTAPSFAQMTNCTVTASVSQAGYSNSQSTVQITVVSTLNTGIIQLCVQDDKGTAVKDAVVMTTTQPSGIGTLTDITNSTGYVTFHNAVEGQYTFTINKLGYKTTNQTINFIPSQAINSTVTLTKTAANQPQADLTIVWLGLVAAAVAIVVVAFAFVQRRRTAAKFKVPKKWTPPPPPKPRS